jgi:hypothetical protein
MKVLMIAAVKHVETIEHILGCVRVHDIQQYSNSHAVSSVYKLLQLVWEAIATAGSEEAIDLVAKAGIVSMFHDGH